MKSLGCVRLFATPWTDCSLQGCSVHGISQARILEWVTISFSRASSQSRDWTQVSCFAGRCFTVWATREVPPSSQWIPVKVSHWPSVSRMIWSYWNLCYSYVPSRSFPVSEIGAFSSTAKLSGHKHWYLSTGVLKNTKLAGSSQHSLTCFPVPKYLY